MRTAAKRRVKAKSKALKCVWCGRRAVSFVAGHATCGATHLLMGGARQFPLTVQNLRKEVEYVSTRAGALMNWAADEIERLERAAVAAWAEGRDAGVGAASDVAAALDTHVARAIRRELT
jgi:hypothetical protein